jgi:3-phenylpropionate/trans-cinnamate dioxygenase ferredoxin reductase component
MAADSTYLIVGASLAGAKAAQTLRKDGFDGPVVLVGDESERPYKRPPLSKEYLLGKAERDKIYVHPPTWYADHDVDLRLETAVTVLDPSAHEVTLADGGRIGYAKLLLTTGSSPRRLSIPGADLDQVLYLHTAADSDRLRDTFASVSRIAVIGGGWIGLETAAAARTAGVEVTVLEAAELPLLRVLGHEVAEVFANLHRENGVDLRTGVQVAEITSRNDEVNGVRLADGSHVAADAVIVGVGASPNSALARGAGLDVDNGIRVDARLQSSDPDIYTAGDVANAFHPLLGKPIRVEHWANARYQPVTAAKAMLGQDVAYDRMPFFYTDQYDLGMEYFGHVEPGQYDAVVFRGDVDTREFAAFWLTGDRLLAGMHVNLWDLSGQVRDLVQSRPRLDKRRLADPQVPLDELIGI